MIDEMISKVSFLTRKRDREGIKFRMYGADLKRVKTSKLLGVHICSSLT